MFSSLCSSSLWKQLTQLNCGEELRCLDGGLLSPGVFFVFPYSDASCEGGTWCHLRHHCKSVNECDQGCQILSSVVCVLAWGRMWTCPNSFQSKMPIIRRRSVASSVILQCGHLSRVPASWTQIQQVSDRCVPDDFGEVLNWISKFGFNLVPIHIQHHITAADTASDPNTGSHEIISSIYSFIHISSQLCVFFSRCSSTSATSAFLAKSVLFFSS